MSDLPSVSKGVPQRVGVLGGTFDPPHYGHLLIAQEAAWQLRLHRVLLMPAHRNPLKSGGQVTDAQHRCRMVELAIRENPLFQLSRADLDRPPPSYTADVLRLLRAGYGNDTAWFFLAGTDVLADLPAWERPEEVLAQATVVVVNRVGTPPVDLTALAGLLPAAAGRIRPLTVPGVDISATAIRERVRHGQPIRYLTPRAVEAYIRAEGLYDSPADADAGPPEGD